jgi:hypothetical protein
MSLKRFHGPIFVVVAHHRALLERDSNPPELVRLLGVSLTVGRMIAVRL